MKPDMKTERANGQSPLDWARLNDSTVHMMLMSGLDRDYIIAELVVQKQKFLERVMELESIAPRKVVLPDGRAMVWRCPDHLVPEVKLA